MKKLTRHFLPCLGVLTLLPAFAAAQYRSPTVPDVPAPVVWGGGETSERSINVDPAVNLSLCVSSGTVKINGWSRNEVRVYVEHGSKFGFTVQMKSPKSGAPALMKVNALATKTKYASPTECIWGNEIEIDVPEKAVVNLKGHEAPVTIDGVKKASVKLVGGDISVRNVAEGIMAYSGQGIITVEESAGPISLETTTGNIVVFDVETSEIGDLFKAKTNGGTVSLQQLAHRRIEVGTISGSILYNGKILDGGSYSMSTLNGSIRMSIPQNSACQLSASYGFGSFNSEIPFKLITENITEGPIKHVVASLGGGGDATVKLSTHNGSIAIKKQ